MVGLAKPNDKPLVFEGLLMNCAILFTKHAAAEMRKDIQLYKTI